MADTPPESEAERLEPDIGTDDVKHAAEEGELQQEAAEERSGDRMEAGDGEGTAAPHEEAGEEVRGDNGTPEGVTAREGVGDGGGEEVSGNGAMAAAETTPVAEPLSESEEPTMKSDELPPAADWNGEAGADHEAPKFPVGAAAAEEAPSSAVSEEAGPKEEAKGGGGVDGLLGEEAAAGMGEGTPDQAVDAALEEVLEEVPQAVGELGDGGGSEEERDTVPDFLAQTGNFSPDDLPNQSDEGADPAEEWEQAIGGEVEIGQELPIAEEPRESAGTLTEEPKEGTADGVEEEARGDAGDESSREAGEGRTDGTVEEANEGSAVGAGEEPDHFREGGMREEPYDVAQDSVGVRPREEREDGVGEGSNGKTVGEAVGVPDELSTYGVDEESHEGSADGVGEEVGRNSGVVEEPKERNAEGEDLAEGREEAEGGKDGESMLEGASPSPKASLMSSASMPTMSGRRPGSASATRRPASASPGRLAAGSGAMAVRGRLAAATSREAVLRQEAEMAAADLEIMSSEKAGLEADLHQETAMRMEVENELAQVLEELQQERAAPYKQQWMEGEAQLKAALARVASLEKELKTLQVDAARDRAVAEVAERKREDAERRRNAAEQKAADAARESAASPVHGRELMPSSRFSSPGFPHHAYHAGCPTCGNSGHPPQAAYPPPNYIPQQVTDEVQTLKGRLSQAEATNAALMKAELVRNGLMENPEDAMERRLRLLEAAVGSPMGSPTRRRQYGGAAMPMLEGTLLMNGAMIGMNGMGMMAPASMGGGMVAMQPQGISGGVGMGGMGMARPSSRMQTALQDMDWQLGRGAHHHHQQQQHPGMMTPQHYPYQQGGGMGYGGGRMESPPAVSPGNLFGQNQYQQEYQGDYNYYNERPPSGASRFERSLRESFNGAGGGSSAPSPHAYQYNGPAVPRNTNPNRMDEEALRQVRMQYHQEKMQMVNMQMARQQAPE